MVYLRSTSGHHGLKLMVSKLDTISMSGTSAQVGQKLKCGPSWSTFFIPGTSDQLGPKFRREKCGPTWSTFHFHPSCAGSSGCKNLDHHGPGFHFCPTWAEVPGAKRWPSWPQLTSGQVDQKLTAEKVPNLGIFLKARVRWEIVSNLDTILLLAMMARSWL